MISVAPWTSCVPDEPHVQTATGPHPTGSRSVAVTVLLVVALAAALYVLGVTQPPKRSAVGSDRLGPDSGANVTTYLVDAADGLMHVGSGPRWALIALRTPIGDDAAWSLTLDTQVSQVAFHVPIAGVTTPTTLAAVTGERASLATARVNAINAVTGTNPETGTPAGRDQRVSRVTAARLRAGCGCIVAMVVRAGGPRLRMLAAAPVVRGVEVLPADAAGGRFAVVPLLPEQTDRVVPLNDSAPVPER